MVGRVRSRLRGDTSPIRIGTLEISSLSTGQIYNKFPYHRFARSREWMLDATHRHWRSERRVGFFDAGSSMHHFKASMNHHPAFISHAGTPGFDAKYEYTGEYYPFPLDGFILGDDHGVENSIPETSLTAQGTIGFNKFKPTASGGGLGQFIGELHEFPRLPSLLTRMRSRSLTFAGMGGDYLNYEFGWRPFVRDVYQTVGNMFSAERRLRQLARDNGRRVRRQGTVSHQESAPETIDRGYSQFGWPALPNFFLQGGREHGYIELNSGTRYRFSACFRYWIPPLDRRFGDTESQAEREQLARIVYGVSLSPSLLYELMPWSWLIDWGSSLGAMVQNYSENSADSLVADYAYCTGRKYSTDNWVVEGTLTSGLSYTAATSFDREMVRRQPASPYGFGIFLPDLSARRIAILAALGFTHLR